MDRKGVINGKALEAMRRCRAEKKAKDERRAKKLSKTNPARLLEEFWHEEVQRRFGVKLILSEWGPAEKSLASKLIKLAGDVDTARDMAERFICEWSGDGLPPFRYFWVARDTYLAKATGQLELERSSDLNVDEFNESAAAASPKHGW